MKRPSRLLIGCCVVAVVAASVVLTRRAYSGAYIFAGEANGVNIITHPLGYTGTGGALSITVGIDPTSANAASMAISVQNIVNTFNALVATTGNLVSGVSNNIPAGQIDFESVALHELGHCLGLAHVNAASESGLGGSDQNYTKATDGANNAFDLGSGADGFKGSSDDARGDDVNLHWFRTSNNNPFTIAGTVDASTYARDTASLPATPLPPTPTGRFQCSCLGHRPPRRSCSRAPPLTRRNGRWSMTASPRCAWQWPGSTKRPGHLTTTRSP